MQNVAIHAAQKLFLAAVFVHYIETTVLLRFIEQKCIILLCQGS